MSILGSIIRRTAATRAINAGITTASHAANADRCLPAFEACGDTVATPDAMTAAVPAVAVVAVSMRHQAAAAIRHAAVATRAAADAIRDAADAILATVMVGWSAAEL